MLQTQKPCKPNCIFSFYLNDLTNWIAYFAQAWIFYLFCWNKLLEFCNSYMCICNLFRLQEIWSKLREMEVCDYHVFTLVERGEIRQLCQTHTICQVCLFMLSYKHRIERKTVAKQSSLQVWIVIQRVINAPT